MICLGLDHTSKRATIADYCAEHRIKKVFGLSPAAYQLQIDAPGFEWVEYADIIRYVYYYRLLQEIDGATLVVVNECLRTQNRNDLTYNCIRNYLNQTSHQLVFQRYPLIDTFDDFMILLDFETRSRWKRDQWRPELIGELKLKVRELPVLLRRVDVATDEKTRAAYQLEKRKLVDGIGLRDPHTIPRNLHLFAGRAKLAAISAERGYVGRNNRFKLDNLETFEEARGERERTVFEFCHRFIDFTDFLARTDTSTVDALVSDLKVDGWYFDRFTQWTERLRNAYAALHG